MSKTYKTELETLIGLIEDKLNTEAMYDATDEFRTAVILHEENLEATQNLRKYIATIKEENIKPVIPIKNKNKGLNLLKKLFK